jgi:hypothetical protein
MMNSMIVMVKAPSGEMVKIVPLDLLINEYPEVNKKQYQYLKGKLPLVKALWFCGPFSNKSGRCVQDIYKKAVEFGFKGTSSALSPHFVLFEQLGLITREVRGRRTFSCNLLMLPNTWYEQLGELEISEQSTEDVPEETNVPAISEIIDEDDFDLAASKVASQLLEQVFQIIQNDKNLSVDQIVVKLNRDVTQLEYRLGEQVQANQVLRRKHSEAADELAAVKMERDALRAKTRQLETNLKAALGSSTDAYVRGEVRKALDQVMREAPIPNSSERKQYDR